MFNFGNNVDCDKLSNWTLDEIVETTSPEIEIVVRHLSNEPATANFRQNGNKTVTKLRQSRKSTTLSTFS